MEIEQLQTNIRQHILTQSQRQQQVVQLTEALEHAKQKLTQQTELRSEEEQQVQNLRRTCDVLEKKNASLKQQMESMESSAEVCHPSAGAGTCLPGGHMANGSSAGHGLVATVTYTRGRGVQRLKNVCVPKIDLQFRAPSIKFIFFLRKTFLMWLYGGGGGQAEEPGLPFRPPPPPVTVSRGLVQWEGRGRCGGPVNAAPRASSCHRQHGFAGCKRPVQRRDLANALTVHRRHVWTMAACPIRAVTDFTIAGYFRIGSQNCEQFAGLQPGNRIATRSQFCDPILAPGRNSVSRSGFCDPILEPGRNCVPVAILRPVAIL